MIGVFTGMTCTHHRSATGIVMIVMMIADIGMTVTTDTNATGGAMTV